MTVRETIMLVSHYKRGKEYVAFWGKEDAPGILFCFV